MATTDIFRAQALPCTLALPSGFLWGSVGRASGEASPTRGRSIRVCALVLAIALMSVADLYITLLYLRTVGMGEGNPLARWMMTTGTSTSLIWWKILTAGTGCSILLYTRRHRSGEAAAWACCLILTWLTIHWSAYSGEVEKITPILEHLSSYESAKWMVLPD